MDTSKIGLFFIFSILSAYLNAQILKSERFNFELNTELDSTETQKMNHFIDNELYSIHLVSLNPYCNNYIDFQTGQEVKNCYFKTIIDLTNNKINTGLIKTTVKIDQKDYEVLFHALYSPKEIVYSGACYMPRHGIIFYDENQQMIAFIEICFECSNIHSLNIQSTSFTDELHKELTSLFRKYMADYLK